MSSVTEDEERYGDMPKANLISIPEAATRLGLKPVTIRQWASARKLARVKLGRRILIPEAEIERLIQENLTPALSVHNAK